MNIPEGILCTRTHEWVLEENNIAIIGLTDWQINKLGDIVVVELPECGVEFQKDECFGTIESVHEADELYMPISGTVVEVNEALINSPELINEDAFENWFIKVKPSDFQNDTEGLLEYSDYIDEMS
ncbi:glycine cleavage system protein GcvH [bacterium]|nr:glycine cleavage system protein GcvH [bacterium]